MAPIKETVSLRLVSLSDTLIAFVTYLLTVFQTVNCRFPGFSGCLRQDLECSARQRAFDIIRRLVLASTENFCSSNHSVVSYVSV